MGVRSSILENQKKRTWNWETPYLICPMPNFEDSGSCGWQVTDQGLKAWEPSALKP